MTSALLQLAGLWTRYVLCLRLGKEVCCTALDQHGQRVTKLKLPPANIHLQVVRPCASPQGPAKYRTMGDLDTCEKRLVLLPDTAFTSTSPVLLPPLLQLSLCETRLRNFKLSPLLPHSCSTCALQRFSSLNRLQSAGGA